MSETTLLNGLVVLGFGIMFLIFLLLKTKQKRLIENMPTSKIRSLAIGLVEIYGEALPMNKKHISPITKKECVYYSYNVEEHRGSGKSSRWVKLMGKTTEDRFYLQDDTGKIEIDIRKASLDIPSKVIYESGFGKDPPKEMIELLESNNLKFENFLGINKKMRFTESTILVHEKIYIMGSCVNEDSKKVIKCGEHDKTYFISNNSEKRLLEKIKLELWIYFVAGFALFIGGIFMIITVLNG